MPAKCFLQGNNFNSLKLAGNAEAGEPRENTEPTPTTGEGGDPAERRGKDAEGADGGYLLTSPKHQKAKSRNLEAFLKGADGGEWNEARGEGGQSAKESLEVVDGRRDPILRKIVDFNRPPVILSLERQGVSWAGFWANFSFLK